jgi:hypothetical protein
MCDPLGMHIFQMLVDFVHNYSVGLNNHLRFEIFIELRMMMQQHNFFWNLFYAGHDIYEHGLITVREENMWRARGNKMSYVLLLPLPPCTSAGWPQNVCICNSQWNSEIFCNKYTPVQGSDWLEGAQRNKISSSHQSYGSGSKTSFQDVMFLNEKQLDGR